MNPAWWFSEDPNQQVIGGETNFTTVLFALAFLVVMVTPTGYYQVREKKTGKRVGPRTYHW